MIRAILSFLTGGALDRVLRTVDAKIAAETDREKIKGDIIREYYRTRGDWLRSGGFWLVLPFALLAAFHYGAVVMASVFWCADCAFPQPWTVAKLPPNEAETTKWIVASVCGVVGVTRFKR